MLSAFPAPGKETRLTEKSCPGSLSSFAVLHSRCAALDVHKDGSMSGTGAFRRRSIIAWFRLERAFAMGKCSVVSLRSAFDSQAFCSLGLAAAWALGTLPSGSGTDAHGWDGRVALRLWSVICGQWSGSEGGQEPSKRARCRRWAAAAVSLLSAVCSEAGCGSP